MAESILPGDRGMAKRRKVRKGTQSCWECKRRKVRCIVSSPSNKLCDNCTRRGTTCISQEYPDKPTLPINNNQTEARLRRVEELLELLIQNTNPSLDPFPLHARDISHEEPLPEAALWKETSQSQVDSPPSGAEACDQLSHKCVTSKYEELVRHLIAAWPSQDDINLIGKLHVGISTHLHRDICTPHSRLQDHNSLSPQEMLQLPPMGSHPVLIARKLMMLATFLQGALGSSFQEFDGRSNYYREIMDRAMDRATKLVTSNDSLVASVEGIECIMIEAMYHNYAGNLHHAWMAVHRAVALAQMMALHRGLSSPSLKILTAEMRATLDPDHMCFRLVEMDRYLSLMLGLPQSSLEARYLNLKALKACHPVDRMQRTHCIVAGLILERNNTDLDSPFKIEDIEKLLLDASADMPPQWWLIPNFSSQDSSGTELVESTAGLLDQLAHYHLLLRLHLPSILQASSDTSHDYSKISALNASREVLSRYIVFRASDRAHLYCRGGDYLAFLSIVVLCLAHVNAQNQHRQLPERASEFGVVCHLLVQSRPSDRGLMERTFGFLESMANSGTDSIASKLTRILSHLLDVEANSANGTIYNTSSSKVDGNDLQCDGKLTNDGETLQIDIPYFGTINFERGAISRSALTTTKHVDLETSIQSDTDELYLDQSREYTDQPWLMEDFALAESDWNLQNIDTALFNSLFCGIPMPDMDLDGTEGAWIP
ncbi:hypothetical protein N7462_004374 [Penicillium macrosclerotiorum]|uniref:uncharacterized protein n=1 Tax=Penicillium macrosclerotiorum TaxID=303699 RepID=UPI002548A350|nr:uncharacterized protein N7462_004374 [Penicillium macrosclerotiorum]KAJ5689982.1 hypothetical protein N7462_004374 [Penicillium macrosclerotiorum]